ncbi:RHAG protein [Balamuthia mandrillaris]
MAKEEPERQSRTGTIIVAKPSKDQQSRTQYGGEKEQRFETITFTLLLVILEGFFVTLYAVWFRYPTEEEAEEQVLRWGYVRDVSIMIFFGFAYLMVFLRHNGFSAIGYTVLLAALVVQWSIPLGIAAEEMHHDREFSERRAVGLLNVLDGLFCSGAVLISYGAILGKATPTQLLIMAVVEPIFFWTNYFICDHKLETVDIGGGYYIHVFGAYFGLVVTWFLTSCDTKGHPDNSSQYSSDILAMAGTIFLWIMWPSFNAAIAETALEQVRALVNTFLSLSGATISAFVFSRLFCEKKFEMVHIQNASLAGGVAMGVAAHLNIYPAAALASGLLCGFISVAGFVYLTPLLNNKANIQDICGVHNLHGLPGIVGILVSVFATAALANRDDEDFHHGNSQWAIQIAALFITLGLALVGGLIAGVLMWACGRLQKLPSPHDLFNDGNFWHLPADSHSGTTNHKGQVEMKRKERESDIASSSDEDEHGMGRIAQKDDSSDDSSSSGSDREEDTPYVAPRK